MSPWDILGWLIVGMVGLFVVFIALLLVALVVEWWQGCRKRSRYRRETRAERERVVKNLQRSM